MPDSEVSPAVVRELFKWIELNFPDEDHEARLQRALAEIDEFAKATGEAPEALKALLQSAMESASERIEFPARLIPRHGSEPVRAEDLRIGGVYYLVGSHDADMLIPSMVPYVFTGFGLAEETKHLACFQAFESYAAGVRYGDDCSDDEADFIRTPRPINGFYTFDVALESVMRAALARENYMNQKYQRLRLESGATIEVKAHTYIGEEMYELNYFTQIPLDDGPSLRAEMLEVWKRHSQTEENDERKFRAVTAHRKLDFVGQVGPNPISIAFRKEGDAWVEFDWHNGDYEALSE